MAIRSRKGFRKASRRNKKRFLGKKSGNKVGLKDFRGFSRNRQRGIINRTAASNRGTGGVQAPPNTSEPGPAGPGPSGAPDPSLPPGGVPAPQLPQSAAAIAGAETDYALAGGVYNQNMLAAAQAYGDPGILEGIGGGPVSPISALSTIARNQGFARTALGERENRDNTFFSGLHIRDLGRQSDEFGNQRLAATQRYQSATQNYNNIYAAALAARDQTIADAGAADITAFEDQPPTDEAPTGDERKTLERRLAKARKSGNKSLIKSIKAKLAKI